MGLHHSNYAIDIADIVTMDQLESEMVKLKTQNKSWIAKVPNSKLELK